MTLYAINLGIFTLLFFIIGMIKPRWVLFFIKEPTRFPILMITPILIMITVTLYGEGVKQAKEEQVLRKKPIKETLAPAPVPVPVPVPATEPPAAPTK